MIIVTGGSGQLGAELKKISNSDFHFPDRSLLNLEDMKSVSAFFDNNKIKIVIHAGAYTNVEVAEDQKDLAKKINIDSTAIISEMSKKHNFKMVYISTDYIFDGKKSSPYTEVDIPNPLNYYGFTKLKGEEAVLGTGAEPVVFRTSWVYSSHGNNFVKKILKLAEQNESLRVISDQIGTLTYAEDLAHIIIKSLNPSLHLSGVYNFSNEGCSSWYDVAHEIMRIRKLATKINPVKSIEYNTKATRPAFSLLDKSKIRNELKLDIPHWTESLEICLQKIY